MRRRPALLASVLTAPLLGAALVAGLLAPAPALAAAPAGGSSSASSPGGQGGWTVLPGAPRLVERLAAPASAAAASAREARTSTSRLSARSPAPGARLSTWQVTYDAGFQRDALARSEFQRAVDTWAALISSPVPITVDARFRALGPRVLGSAGPGSFVEQTRDGRYTRGEKAYPIALGNALAGRDLAPPGSSSGSAFDILANFPNDNPSIYYGTGPVPADKYDFFSTALHEIGHGLGFSSTLEVASGRGSYGFSSTAPYQLDYDRLVTRGTTGTADVVTLPNDSAELGAALQGGQLYWRGSRATAANGGVRPKLFAPSSFQDGSSIGHLDEDAFPTGTADALMTPSGEPGELNAAVGDIALGMLADIGWSVQGSTPTPTAAPTPTATASPSAAPVPAPTASTPPTPAPTSSPAPGPTAPASRFTALTPLRLLDTRTGLGLSEPVRVGDDGAVDLTVVGGSTGVPAGATAVVLNVTAVAATRATDVRVYPTPTDGGVPTVSNINLRAGQTRAGVVTVPVGDGGRVRLRNEAGLVSLLADLAGYYAPDAEAAFHPLSPVRLLDTRSSTTAPKLGPGQVLDLQVAGTAGVPASASAVALTVTGVAATRQTDLAVYPTASGGGVPTTSNVNLVPGPPVPNLVVVKVGDGGRVRLRNSAGSTAVLVDLSGFYDATAPGGQLFRATQPVRLFDTRAESDPERRTLGPGGRGVYRVTDGPSAVPASATAVLLNVTGVAATAGTDVRVYPFSTGSAPTVSNLNLAAGQTAANAVVVRIGADGDVLFRNQSGRVALLSDLAGWFGPA